MDLKSKVLLTHEDKPIIVAYPTFTAEECYWLMSLLICKRELEWKQYVLWNGSVQPRVSLAFSYGWRYRYSGVNMDPYPINKHKDIFDIIIVRINQIILDLKKNGWVDEDLQKRPDYWLCHTYRDGDDSISAHADDESDLAPGSPIISISFGAERKFRVRDSDDRIVLDHIMKSGTVIVMLDPMQKKYTHEVPKENDCNTMRVNMTGRFLKPF